MVCRMTATLYDASTHSLAVSNGNALHCFIWPSLMYNMYIDCVLSLIAKMFLHILDLDI